jgi:hypothetical protein
MIKKTASVPWEGPGKKGLGQISTETGALKCYPYGFASRFEDDRLGTNLEEILGAAAAQHDCPLSRALANVPKITLQATLVDSPPWVDDFFHPAN